jgi:hypothetical protein
MWAECHRPVILSTQEAEIRRIQVGSQPWVSSLRDIISKIPITQKGWWTNSSGKNAYLASVRLSSNPSTTKKKKKERNCSNVAMCFMSYEKC